jgi:hypothetical protein
MLRARTLIIAAAALLCNACINANSGALMQPIVRNVPYDITLAANPAVPVPGQPTLLTFTVRENGKPADVYAVPAQVIRISLASSNGRDFHHAFSDIVQKEPGTYELSYTFTENDAYRIWIEIPNLISSAHHGKDSGYIGFSDIPVGDGSDTANTAQDIYEVTDGTMTVSLAASKTIIAGVPQTFDVKIASAGGQQFETAPADHFYALVSSKTGMYRLEHTDHAKQQKQGFTTDTIIFEQPGTHVLWMELYLFEGSDEMVRILNPVFILTVQ